MTFRDLQLSEGLLEGLDAMGFENPTPIQEMAIPHVIEGDDLIAVAQTGTGKTAAFLLPLLHKLELDPGERFDTLVICPTRELAKQIDQQVMGLAYFTGASSMPIYGGGDAHGFEQEKVALTSGVNIIVATPGKMIAHLNLGYVNFEQIRHVVLDEADRMLDMGFYDDIMRIMRKCPEARQTLLFSATMPQRIRDLAKRIMKEPKEVNIGISKPAAGVLQGAYLAHNDQKVKLVTHLLAGKEEEYQSVIIFSSTKRNVKDIHHTLKRKNFNVGAIHSDLEQAEREEVLLQFRNRKVQVLVATDVIARGIDIDSISLVINFDVPSDAEDYVHRVGRTARAAQTGVALTFISGDDVNKFYRIEQLIETEVNKLPLPEELGEGPVYAPRKGKPKGGNNRRWHGKGKGGGKGGPKGKGGGNRNNKWRGKKGGGKGQGGNSNRSGGGGKPK